MSIARPLALGLLSLCSLLTAPATESRKVLLLDASRIESSENIRMSVGKVVKSSHNPLFTNDRRWEPRFDNLYPNIIWDEQAGLYKCWYNPFLVEVEDWMGSTPERKRWLYLRDSGLCYAESKDGIHWRKPSLGVYTFYGEPCNIVMRDVHGIGVFLDKRETNPERRYKSFFVNQKAGKRTTLAVAFSADGIHWGRQTVLNNVKVMGDTHNNALWAPTLNRYVAFTRDWSPREWQRDSQGNIPAIRLASRIESRDFENWSDPKEVMRGVDDDHQIYEILVFYHGGVYLAFPVIYEVSSGHVHFELAWSTDTINWHRIEPGQAVIPLGPEGSFDWGCIYPSAYPLFEKDGIKLYYSGSNGTHSAERKSYLAFATMRPDGFAAATQSNADKPGVIVTTPIRFSEGDRLLVSADVETGGSLIVSALDGQGREIAQSYPLPGSVSGKPVTWRKQNSNPLSGKTRLQFSLSGARLYSYDIIPTGTGN
ncbi:MAG: hypothetical protein HS122_03205 [Opitutaceae bacterium]|nr:hypothetical protein [Opitutaceae bacterium]